jgi:hypothetical protein
MSPYARRVYATTLLMVTGFTFLSRLTQIAPPSTRFVSSVTIRGERYAHLRCAFIPSSNRARVSGKLVHFQLPRGGQFSVAADIQPDFGQISRRVVVVPY